MNEKEQNENELAEKYMNNPLLIQIYKNLVKACGRMESGVTDYRLANVEISAEKHKLQSVALDYMIGRKVSNTKKLTK